MESREYKSVDCRNCMADDAYYDFLAKILEEIKKNKAPYKGGFELEVEMEEGRISTVTKKKDNLSDDISKMVDSLEAKAQAICKSGKEPNKVITEAQVEKEL